MGHNTSSSQRKVRTRYTNRPKKVKSKPAVKAKVVQPQEDPSCQISGCGCGN